jgi:tetratricopeptide (TPR) repeat protein
VIVSLVVAAWLMHWLTASLAAGGESPASQPAAQSAPPACAGRECVTAPDHATASDQLWAAATLIHQHKNEFVDALRQFAESVAGSYGDEGSRILSSLDAMRGALLDWDAAIGTYRMTAGAAGNSADLHVALGSVFLERSLVQDALAEFAAAGRLDPKRADVQELAAMAHDLAGNPAAAASALEHACALDAHNPATWYNLSRHLALLEQQGRARDAQRSFLRLPPELPQGQGGTPAIQFERVSLLRQAAGIAPIFLPVLYAPGLQHLTAGRYEQAIASFREAAARDPLRTSPWAGPAMQASATLRLGQLQAGISRLRAAVAQGPDQAEAYRILGLAYWADAQYDNSVAALRQAVRLNPQDERSRMALADVLVAAGQSAEAEQTLREAIQVSPESGQAHYRLGQLYRTQSSLPSAIEELERAAMLDPLIGLDHLYETIGGLYVNQASFDAAVTAYGKRIDANPNNAEAHRKLGEIYFLQGRHDEALTEFTVTELLDPASADAYAESGQVYLRLGQYAEAATASRRAIALDADHQKARYTLGTSLVRLGQVDEGQRELDVFRRMVAESAASLQRRSELNTLERDAARSLAKGEYVAAVSLLQQAIAYEPDLPQPYLDLGLALMKAGQHREALDSFMKAKGLADTADVHKYLSDAYRMLGRVVDSERESTLYRQLVEQAKEKRLRENPLLR